MAVNDFTGQNIQDTYQRVVQTDGTSLADGAGSLLPISFNGNNVIISGSLTATEYSVTSSVTNVIFQQQSGSTIFGDSQDDTHLFTGNLTASGNISSSGTITANAFVGDLTGTATNVSNFLVVDNTTLKLDTGIVYDGTNVRTISIKDGGVDSDALAADITVTSLTSTHVTASGNISASGDLTVNNINGNIDGGTF